MTSWSFVKTTSPVTNVLECHGPVWNWQPLKDILWLNSSNKDTTDHTASALLEDAQQADENIQQFMARYKW